MAVTCAEQSGAPHGDMRATTGLYAGTPVYPEVLADIGSDNLSGAENQQERQDL